MDVYVQETVHADACASSPASYNEEYRMTHYDHDALNLLTERKKETRGWPKRWCLKWPLIVGGKRGSADAAQLSSASSVSSAMAASVRDACIFGLKKMLITITTVPNSAILAILVHQSTVS